MLAKKIISYNDVSLSTIQRYISLNRQAFVKQISKDRRSFEMQFPNDCWQSDISVGPYLNIEDKKKRTFLVAFLDDSSRVITHAQYYFEDNLISLQDCFKKAVSKRGIPNKLFVDNGKVFKSDQFNLICAALGTTLSYAQPYSPESKGKIERFFLTLKNQWMYMLDPSKISSISELNELLWEYLERDYHQNIHSSIGMKPIDKFIKNVDKIKYISSKEELDFIFLHKVVRTVKKDSTISIFNTIYEVPMEYIDEKVNVRFDATDMKKAYLFSIAGKCIKEIYPVDKIANSKVIRNQPINFIDFSNITN